MTGGCRVCVSLAPTRWGRLADLLREAADADLAEVRLDALEEPIPGDEALAGLVADSPLPLLLTCRPSWQGGGFSGEEARRREILERAAAAGPAYVDVELEAEWAGEWIPAAPAPVVLSHHFETPRPADLPERTAAARSASPAVVKLVAPAEEVGDVAPLLDAGRRLRAAGQPAVTFCSGEAGMVSRLLAAAHGAPFTYAASPRGAPTAPGQWSVASLRQELRVQRWRPGATLCGLLGDPLEHSLSPTIFNAAFEARSREAAYLPLPGADLDAVLALAEREGIAGASVTMPFKRRVMERCAEVDPGAARIGAVNTLVRGEDGWVGHNTDGVAVVAALERVSPVVGQRVVILGAGGAARAAAVALADVGARVTVLNRTPERAAEVAEWVDGDAGPLDALRSLAPDVVINATPVGMGRTARTPIPTAWLDGGEVVLDMVYRPLDTPLLRGARERGCRTVSGLEMFLEQAVRQYRLWFREEAPLAVMREAALRRLRPGGGAPGGRTPA